MTIRDFFDMAIPRELEEQEEELGYRLMTRTEYELIYDAFKSHRYKMTDAQEVL